MWNISQMITNNSNPFLWQVTWDMENLLLGINWEPVWVFIKSYKLFLWYILFLHSYFLRTSTLPCVRCMLNKRMDGSMNKLHFATFCWVNLPFKESRTGLNRESLRWDRTCEQRHGDRKGNLPYTHRVVRWAPRLKSELESKWWSRT